jgi:hypothetical protein
MWQQWLNGVLGLWIIALPFLGLDAQTALWTMVVTGVVVAALGFWGATEHSTMHMRPTGGMRHA